MRKKKKVVFSSSWQVLISWKGDVEVGCAGQALWKKVVRGRRNEGKEGYS